MDGSSKNRLVLYICKHLQAGPLMCTSIKRRGCRIARQGADKIFFFSKSTTGERSWFKNASLKTARNFRFLLVWEKHPRQQAGMDNTQHSCGWSCNENGKTAFCDLGRYTMEGSYLQPMLSSEKAKSHLLFNSSLCWTRDRHGVSSALWHTLWTASPIL